MSKLMDKVKRLYALANLRPEEEADAARVNEARNAAMMLLKTCRDGGVRIKFTISGEAEERPERPQDHVPSTDPFKDFMEMFRNQARGTYSAAQPGRSADPFVDEMMRAIREKAAREQKAARDVNEAYQRASRDVHGAKQPPPGFDSSDDDAQVDFGAAYGEPPLIRSRFGGRCIKCGQVYSSGDAVYWSPGAGTAHERCGSEGMRARPR